METPDYGPPPDWQSWPAYQLKPQPKRSRLKTYVGGLALAGLLVVGGATAVFAASPSPDASSSPNVTTPGTPGTTDGGTNGGTRTPGNCPHDQTTTDTSTDTSSGS
jgi:hypothetical protein